MTASYNYAFVFLMTGEQADTLDDAAVTLAGQGHHAHIDQMGTEGTLLLAGPFGEARADDRWRGLYIFDLANMDDAYDLARSDPSVQAGLFDVTIVPWQSDTDLRPLRNQIEQDKTAGAPFVPAAYVLAIGDTADGLQGVLHDLRKKGQIICSGELGGDRKNQLLILFRAETVDEAKTWLNLANGAPGWEFASLWATARLGELTEGP